MSLIGRTSTDGTSSAVVLDDGTLWVVGNNGYGQLGLGDKTNRSDWTQVGTDTDWAKVYMGGGNFFAISKLRRIYRSMGNQYLSPIHKASGSADTGACTAGDPACSSGNSYIQKNWYVPSGKVCILLSGRGQLFYQNSVSFYNLRHIHSQACCEALWCGL